ncbi:hypothetical protein NUM3379_05220 [Kineococcus sp. NUM-3379]
MTDRPGARPRPGAPRRPGWGLVAALALPFAVLTVLVATGYGPLLALDGAVNRWAGGLVAAEPALGRAGRVVEAVTQPGWWWVCASAVALVAVWRGARRSVGVVAVAIIVGGAASPLAKDLVGRRRPPLDTLLTTAEGGAFPSGHVLAATVVGGCGALVAARALRRAAHRRLVWALWVAVVALVALDRLVVGAHWLSDTLGSVSLGAAVVAAAARVLAGTDPDRGPGPRRAPGRGWARPG